MTDPDPKALAEKIDNFLLTRGKSQQEFLDYVESLLREAMEERDEAAYKRGVTVEKVRSKEAKAAAYEDAAKLAEEYDEPHIRKGMAEQLRSRAEEIGK